MEKSKINNLNREENPKEYLRNLLCEEDFAKLEKLHDDTKEAVDWKTLASPWVCEINSDGKLEWVVWPSDLGLEYLSNLTSLEPIVEVKGDLWIYNCDKLTGLKPIKEVWWFLHISFCGKLASLKPIKTIWKYLHITNCVNLADLWYIEEINEKLVLVSCNKLENLEPIKIVWLNLEVGLCKKLKSLESIEEVWGNLVMYFCNELEKLNPIIEVKGDLGVDDCGKLEGLDTINRVWKDFIMGKVKLYFQILVLLRKLKDPNFIWWNIKSEELDRLFQHGVFNFEGFSSKYWKHIWEIKDEEWKKEAKIILVYFYRAKKIETEKKIESLVKEPEIKKEEVQRLHDEFVEFKTKIENFWIKVEELEIN